MVKENPYLTTTIATIVAMVTISLVIYLQTQSLEFTDIIIFAVVFWIVFLLSHSLTQRYLSKRLKRKVVKKK